MIQYKRCGGDTRIVQHLVLAEQWHNSL